MKIIDFVQGLTFHKTSKNSQFYQDLKRILDFSKVPFFDPCCVGDTVANNGPFPVRYLDGVLQTVNDGDWVDFVASNGVLVNITQDTSKTTTVVADGNRGVITTVALTDAADTSFEFTFTNSKIVAGSVIQLTGLNSGTGVLNTTITSIGTGTCVLRVQNVGTAAFNSLVEIHYLIS